MTKKSLRVALTVAVFGSMSVVCNGQSNAPASVRTYKVDNTRIRVLIPPEMDVAMTPRHFESELGTATLSYKLRLPGREPARGLHWNFYVFDAGGELVNKGSWEDAGEWKPGSEVEEDALLYCKIKPEEKLAIVLGAVENDAGVRKISEKILEQNLGQILAGRAALPEARFVTHADLSEEDEDGLLKRSLKVLLSDNDLRRDLKLSVPALLIMPDGPNAAPPTPDVQLISEEFVKERLRVGEAVKYLRYVGVGANGNVITVTFNCHAPRMIGNGPGYIPMGVQVNFTYLKRQSGFVFEKTETVHF